MNPKILRTLSYGMYAIGVEGEERPSACIVNTVVQIASSPMIIAVSINHNNYTNDRIKATGKFSVSVLSEDTSGAVIGALGFNSGRNTDKLANINYKVLRENVPVLRENICCWFLCKVINTVETMTHTIFIAEIKAGSDDYSGTPMTYDYYHRVIKGRAPKNAPTFMESDITRNDNSPQLKYVCPICRFVYKDSEQKVPFDQLPDDWKCPICGVPKKEFKIEG